MRNNKKPDPLSNPEEASDRSSARRRVLKTALFGGAAVGAFKFAPEQWTRPIVQAVTLPAHAQMSPREAIELPDGPWAGGASPPSPGPERSRGIGERLLDLLIPAARAQQNDLSIVCEAGFTICIETVDDDTIRIRWGFDNVEDDGSPIDVDVYQTGGQLAFDTMLDGIWQLDGMLSENGKTWEGRVSGDCPTVQERTTQNKGLFGFQLIRSANAGDSVAGLDLIWTATDEQSCSLGVI